MKNGQRALRASATDMALVQIKHAGRIATVSFDRGTKANALSLDLMKELTVAARSFEDDHETACVVLRGRDDNFCLGFDLTDPATLALKEMPLSQRRIALSLGSRLCKAWEDIAPLTICAVEGWCVGGGLALAATCDLRVASDSTSFYIPEIARGLNMSWGSVPRITNLVGPAKAKRLILLAEKLTAADAVLWGLADRLAPSGGTYDAAQSWAETAAHMPPVALRMCKRDINAYANALAHVASHSDYDGFTLMHASDDAAEGVASFVERRPPDFTGS
ncbi:enoyl-CoA hydratase/isomerase family protein [Sulfitobacter sp.]|uniref:enoyl-CoA hydratase/isomerase family protein n=1 Tax=Sulfitobacter sp. TaxID=1903071 RepID=UPI0030028BFE